MTVRTVPPMQPAATRSGRDRIRLALATMECIALRAHLERLQWIVDHIRLSPSQAAAVAAETRQASAALAEMSTARETAMSLVGQHRRRQHA